MFLIGDGANLERQSDLAKELRSAGRGRREDDAPIHRGEYSIRRRLPGVRWFLRVLFGLALLVVLLVAFHQPLLTAAGRFLIVADPLEKADVIIALSGGLRDERIKATAELYRRGYAPRVILSGGEEMAGISIPELQRRQAVGNGIPEDVLIIEGGSTSTAEQAAALRTILERRGMRRGIVVTSSFHARRTRYLFRRAFAGSGIDVRVYPVEDDYFDPVGWWKRPAEREWVVLEYIKFGLALFR